MTRAVTLAEIADTNTFVVDGTNVRVGINSSIPTTTLDVGGAVKATAFTGDGSGLTGIANTAIIGADQINVTGVVTATSFVGNVTGNATGLTGTPDIAVRNITGVAATFTGVLTYEDVTNIDSVGIITARTGIHVTGGKVFIGSTSDHGPSAYNLANAGLSITAAGENALRVLDSTSSATDVGGAILIGGNYRSAGDTQPFVELKSFKENGTDSNYAYGFRIGTTSNGGSITERLRITSGGDIGIGNVTSPSNNIEIRTDANDEGILLKSTGSTSNALDFDANRSGVGNGLASIRGKWNGTTVAQITFLAGSDTTNKDDGVITFGTESAASNGNANADEKLRIDSSGRMLVGTTASPTAGNGQYSNIVVQGYPNTPTGAGHISLQRGQAAFGNNNQIGLINFGDNTGASYAGIECYADANSGNNNYPGRIVFSTTSNGAASPTERVRITKDGYLQIAMNSSNEARLQFAGTGSRIQYVNAGHVEVYTNSAVRNRFLYNGQGTEFSNQSKVIPTTDNAVDLGQGGSRWDDVYATNGTIQTSDSRLKQEVETSVLGTDFVKALRPVSYKWIESKKVPIVDGTDENGENIYRTDGDGNWVYESRDGARKHWGFIAQEVKQVVDDVSVDFAGWTLSDKDDPNSTQSLRYEEFIAPLTKALQEAISEIETLKQRLTDAGL